MRLTAAEVSAIKASALEVFGTDAVVRLFGSRADHSARGGDIDLHVETAAEHADIDHEVLFRSLLWKRLDEPQVDVVVHAKGGTVRWIDSAAFREGIVL